MCVYSCVFMLYVCVCEEYLSYTLFSKNPYYNTALLTSILLIKIKPLDFSTLHVLYLSLPPSFAISEYQTLSFCF